MSEKTARKKSQPAPEKTGKNDSGATQRQLTLLDVVPKTPGNTAPLSTHLARTPLFSPRKRGPRRLVSEYELPSPKGMLVLYTGYELDMGDQDVYLLALHLAANRKSGERIHINRADFIRRLGRTSLSKTQYKWLEEVFFRLGKGTVQIQTSELKILMPLLGGLVLDKETGRYSFSIPEDTMSIFLHNFYGYIDLDIRNALGKRIDLAKWLQGYASSHSSGEHRISLDLLKIWCGYRERIHKFREALGEALNELRRVGLITEWEFYNENKYVRWMRIKHLPKPRPMYALFDEQDNAD